MTEYEYECLEGLYDDPYAYDDHCLQQLEEKGLCKAICYGPYGPTHFRLTPAGRKIIEGRY